MGKASKARRAAQASAESPEGPQPASAPAPPDPPPTAPQDEPSEGEGGDDDGRLVGLGEQVGWDEEPAPTMDDLLSEYGDGSDTPEPAVDPGAGPPTYRVHHGSVKFGGKLCPMGSVLEGLTVECAGPLLKAGAIVQV